MCRFTSIFMTSPAATGQFDMSRVFEGTLVGTRPTWP